MSSIAILEEDDIIGALLEEWLAGAGYTTRRTGLSPCADTNPARDDIGLIIVDLSLPEQDGAETVRALRRAHPAAAILATSGRFHADIDGSPEAARRLGAHRVLSKPFRREDVLEAARALIGPPGARRP
jgi:DNA-binding response OmpR family regulator